GNPLACSAAIAAISYTLENDIPGQAKEKGEFLMKYLNEFKEKYPGVLIDARGAGLLIALEFPSSEVGYHVTKELFARNVMTAGTLVNAKTVRIEPAAVMSYETLKTGMERLDEALAVTAEKFGL
ncbi:MAG: aminotransferase class III-fold pyridoxal phosphate-dependent enzyme, partial [Firmicutes bacterium]|nr:aminotransferase class III-fold pyridoxal phosphate-dependent enzyme [Bacillota bacterium]